MDSIQSKRRQNESRLSIQPLRWVVNVWKGLSNTMASERINWPLLIAPHTSRYISQAKTLSVISGSYHIAQCTLFPFSKLDRIKEFPDDIQTEANRVSRCHSDKGPWGQMSHFLASLRSTKDADSIVLTAVKFLSVTSWLRNKVQNGDWYWPSSLFRPKQIYCRKHGKIYVHVWTSYSCQVRK